MDVRPAAEWTLRTQRPVGTVCPLGEVGALRDVVQRAACAPFQNCRASVCGRIRVLLIGVCGSARRVRARSGGGEWGARESWVVRGGRGTFWVSGDNRSVVGVEGSSDGVVIGQSRRRPEAFAVVFDRHYDAVRVYLSRRVGRELAEDLASQTFVVAFERRRDFRPESGSARPWLLGIATNLLRNHWRAEQRTLEMLARLEPAAGDPGPEPNGSSRVAAALATLEREQRDVLLLYAWGELSYEEIARSLQIPVGTVRSRLARARAHMQSQVTLERSTDA